MKNKQKIIALYGGSFKPPHKGHYAVVEKALKQNPEVDEMIIYIGNAERDGVTQDQSEKIWNIYAKYLPYKVKFEKVASPIRSIFDYAKNNPDEKIIWVIGAREGNEEDFNDIATRTKNASLRPNIQVETIITPNQVSGTAARNSLSSTLEKFRVFLPDFIKDDEAEEIFALLKTGELVSENLQDREDSPNLYNLARKYNVGLYKIITNLLKGAKIEMANSENEEMAMNQSFNMLSKDLNYYDKNLDEELEGGDEVFLKYIAPLTKFMESEGLVFKPYPKIKLIKDDIENGEKVLGNTAHFDPNNNVIVLYTYKRHPKDILRSYAHELIHVYQNVEDRLNGMSNTTNVNEDDYLEKLEREAYEKGNILFRKWTNSIDQQSLNEGLPKNKWEVLPSPKPYSDELINLVQTAYKNTDKGSFVNTTSDLVKSDWVALDFDDEPDIDVTIFYRNSKANETWEGNKIQGIGHDGTREAINKVLSELEKLLSKPGNWVEASDALEHILYKMGVPYVKDENTAQLVFPNTNLEFTGDKGKYLRDLGSGGKAKETIFGNPKIKDLNESTDVDFQNLEKYLDDMFDDLKIDINFTRHFKERVVQRNITEDDIKDLMEKIHDKYGDKIQGIPELHRRVLKHLTKNVDIVAAGNGIGRDDGKKDIALVTTFKKGIEGDAINNPKRDPVYAVAEKKDPFGLNAYTMELARLAENGSQYTIYVDVDGVIADFDTRFENITGLSPIDFESKHGIDEFWKVIDIDNKIKFWIGIPVMPGAKDLIDFVKNYNYELLTAPSKQKSSILGKRLWVKKHVGSLFPATPKINFRQAENKSKIKKELTDHDILIDDRKSTIDSWNAKGGVGILYVSASQSINDLKQLGL